MMHKNLKTKENELLTKQLGISNSLPVTIIGKAHENQTAILKFIKTTFFFTTKSKQSFAGDKKNEFVLGTNLKCLQRIRAM